MPQFETSDHVSTRSVLRHRPIGTRTGSVGKRSVVTTAASPVVQRASRPRRADVTDDVVTWQRGDVIADDERDTYPPVQTRPGNRRVGAVSNPDIPQTPRPRTGPIEREVVIRRRHAHPLLYLGIGMLGMLVLWTLLSAALGWFNTVLDDIHYGRPRTFQADAWVGHNEQTGVPSHFIALNLNGHVEIIEISGGDAAHSHVYVGPQLYGKGDDLVPVTLQFAAVNGDGKPDMIVSFQGSRTVFINDQGAFRPLQPGERQQVEQFLQNMKH
ncbi:MAG TPA: hypothetical protein VEL31_15100 [Ktedonobacteraceae bacterium]|nr:hypothetical protein [Ktedonobacteraceae bacterium]